MEGRDRMVCAECFADDGIRDFINNRSVSGRCWYCDCHATITTVVSLDDLASHIESCLSEEYGRAVDILGWANEMGGYIGTTSDSRDLLYDTLKLSDNCKRSNRLIEDLAELLPEDDWCDRSAYGLNDQELVRFSWEHFCEVIMYSRRFFFADYRTNHMDHDIDAPFEVLGKLFDYAQSYSLMVELPARTELFRARWQEYTGQLSSPKDLGPPPQNKATQSNRMSPPGIVMFYASDHPETALRETAVSPGEFVVGRFETNRPAIVLDLTRVPSLPSLFQETSESLEFRPRQVLSFLNHIAEEISKPIERGQRAYIEYTPTQVVTEYIRSRLLWNGSHVDGVRYSSSVHRGHSSYVLFATEDDVYVDSGDQGVRYGYRLGKPWLILSEKNHQSVTQLVLYRWGYQ